jgi:hypothetical protein
LSDRISYPFRMTDKIIVQYILNFKFSVSKL